jgi:hypothetical protein
MKLTRRGLLGSLLVAPLWKLLPKLPTTVWAIPSPQFVTRCAMGEDSIRLPPSTWEGLEVTIVNIWIEA